MIQEIITYKKIVSNIDNLMNKSPYKKNYIIEQVGIPGPTFYRKLKTQTFTADEILAIAKILSPEEFFLMEFKEEIEQARSEAANGLVKTHEQFLQEFKQTKETKF